MPYLSEERQCNCPVAFPDDPLLKTTVHRYNCPWTNHNGPSLPLIAGCRDYWIQDIPDHLLLAQHQRTVRHRYLWMRYAAHTCIKIMVAEALLEA